MTEIKEATRQIYNLTALLRLAAEHGEIENLGTDVVEDVAALIMEKLEELDNLVEQGR